MKESKRCFSDLAGAPIKMGHNQHPLSGSTRDLWRQDCARHAVAWPCVRRGANDLPRAIIGSAIQAASKMRPLGMEHRILVGTTLLAFALLCTPTFAVPFTSFGGHWYTLSSGPSEWAAAEAEALALGGHLVAINTAEEQAFLVSTYLAGADANTKSFWIGINDQAAEGLFVWSSGESVTYTNWYTGEPNDSAGTLPEGEDFGVLNWQLPQTGMGSVGTWNDVPNGGVNGSASGPLPMFGIIELTSSPVPEIDPAGIGSAMALASGGVALLERQKRSA